MAVSAIPSVSSSPPAQQPGVVTDQRAEQARQLRREEASRREQEVASAEQQTRQDRVEPQPRAHRDLPGAVEVVRRHAADDRVAAGERVVGQKQHGLAYRFAHGFEACEMDDAADGVLGKYGVQRCAVAHGFEPVEHPYAAVAEVVHDDHMMACIHEFDRSLADGGTLFLDEIGDMPQSLQAKLLRALQEGEIEPLGSNKLVPFNVRILAATSRDLAALVREGKFREDLFYRLHVLPVRVPPLRVRRSDIPALVESLGEDLALRNGTPPPELQPDALALLAGQPWRGNIRELRNVLEQAVMRSDSSTIDAAQLARIADLCCGAGPAAIALAGRYPQAEVLAIDINRDALELTQVNAELAGARNVHAVISDLLGAVEGGFDLITANPPYLLDAAQRSYRHGGGQLGEGLALRIVETALQRLNPGGALMLYTGVAVVDGQDVLLRRAAPMHTGDRSVAPWQPV
eukprot:gene25105-31522_t